MKRFLLILTACFALTVFVVPVQAATVWFPTESGQIDVNFLNLSGFDLAIFDDADVGFSTPLVLNAPGDTIFFSQVNSDWVLTSSQTSNTITLADSFNFILALNINNSWTGNTDFEKLAFGLHNVIWGEIEAIAMIDAQPVPLPASILLLGTGLVGLIGFRRRK